MAQKFGYDIIRHNPSFHDSSFPMDFDEEASAIIGKVRNYTRTPPERVFVLVEAMRYIVNHDVPGAIVECGVWRGGSMMAAALTLKTMHCEDRDLYLYDTFEGNPAPGEEDIYHTGKSAQEILEKHDKKDERSFWCRVGLEKVQRAMHSTEYRGTIHFVQGKVEDTIPEHSPEQIALLRLDTDWYESTRHELIHLFPRVVPGGIVIIDDYGHWQGSRKAVDEYLAENNLDLFLCRIDSSARVAVVSNRWC
jgi:hypothetical protein